MTKYANARQPRIYARKSSNLAKAVLALREDGLTFKAIGDRLGFTKQAAYQFYLQATRPIKEHNAAIQEVVDAAQQLVAHWQAETFADQLNTAFKKGERSAQIVAAEHRLARAVNALPHLDREITGERNP